MERLLFPLAHVLFFTSRLFHSTAHAATPWGDCASPTIDGKTYDVATIQCLEPLFRNTVVALVQLAGVALFIMFVVGGFQYLMAGGNAKPLEQARHTITYAIIGVVVIVVAYLILRIIQAFTGVNVVEFFIPKQ